MHNIRWAGWTVVEDMFSSTKIVFILQTRMKEEQEEIVAKQSMIETESLA